MNNDIVVKQKPGAQASATDLTVKQPPQAAPAPSEQLTEPEAEPASPQTADDPSVAQKASQPVGIIVAAVFVAACLIAVAIYIGYNQSQVI